MGKAGKGTGSFGTWRDSCGRQMQSVSHKDINGACCLLQVKGATRHIRCADGVEDGLSTFRRAHARHVATQQRVSGNVRDH